MEVDPQTWHHGERSEQAEVSKEDNDNQNAEQMEDEEEDEFLKLRSNDEMSSRYNHASIYEYDDKMSNFSAQNDAKTLGNT